MNHYVNNTRFLELINSGRSLTAKEKRYVEQIIEQNQEVISKRTAIGLVVSRSTRRVSGVSEGVSF